MDTIDTHRIGDNEILLKRLEFKKLGDMSPMMFQMHTGNNMQNFLNKNRLRVLELKRYTINEYRSINIYKLDTMPWTDTVEFPNFHVALYYWLRHPAFQHVHVVKDDEFIALEEEVHVEVFYFYLRLNEGDVITIKHK